MHRFVTAFSGEELLLGVLQKYSLRCYIWLLGTVYNTFRKSKYVTLTYGTLHSCIILVRSIPALHITAILCITLCFSAESAFILTS